MKTSCSFSVAVDLGSWHSEYCRQLASSLHEQWFSLIHRRVRGLAAAAIVDETNTELDSGHNGSKPPAYNKRSIIGLKLWLQEKTCAGQQHYH